MTTPSPKAFDVCGPLPSGTTVLEASAGTGKTFTIAALATRYVAEGVADLSQMLVVTFGRAATRELRDRVRERLVVTMAGLADPESARRSDDVLVRRLAACDDAEVRRRADRVRRALAAYDSATIATTHGFCQQMLHTLGLAGTTDASDTFLEDVGDLVDEVVDDLYVRKWGRTDADEPNVPYTCARTIARAAVADAQARLEPSDADKDSEPGQRHGLALAVRREVDARKRRRGLLDFGDLLTRLRDALRDEAHGATARERVRSRYRVVLVDEFQDTDPVQWEILSLAFHGHTTLVLIGDPKQAIYAFRGADVATYLAAAGAATEHRTLARNWRSEASLLGALDAFFGGAALGDRRITVRRVDPAYDGPRRLHGSCVAAPMRIRVVRREQVPRTTSGLTRAPDTRALIAADVAADVVRLLQGTARAMPDGTTRPLLPGDVAVLVRKNAQASLVRDELTVRGVPAVVTGTSSVFRTAVAREWLLLLQAMEQPHRSGLVRAAALTPFVGWTAERLAQEGDAALETLAPLLRGWADVLASRGVAALLEVVTAGGDLPRRILARVDGERDMTDLRHVAEVLHGAAVEGHLGPTSVREWLQRRIREAPGDTTEDRSRRLESDADAVQVVTVHASKGLEFLVVYVPFAWDRFTGNEPDVLRLHAQDGTRALDVGGSKDPGHRDRLRVHEAEEAGEDLRLLYVALTRARDHVVTWWAPASTARGSSLHRMLFGRFGVGEEPPQTVAVPRDADATTVLQDLADRSGGTILVEPADPGPVVRWEPPATRGADLAVAGFDRNLDTAWRRTSYTALTSAASHAAEVQPDVRSEPEPEVEERADEPARALRVESVAVGDGASAALQEVASPLGGFPGGAAFGTVVHEVLEAVDTSAPDLAAELGARCGEVLRGRLSSGVDPAALAMALLPVLETPLGPLAGGRRLRDLPPDDRLAELSFELPLTGGDDPSGNVTLSAVADVLRRHVPPGDPLAGYPDILGAADLAGQRLRGYLNGSIDAVLRVRGPEGPRFLVVDYKTNWLGPAGAGSAPLTAWDYRPSALSAAMLASHYPLQALLYAVALHRYLRWRLPAYDPDTCVGGVLYLFVRGMCGPSTPVIDGVPCGVFSWRPPSGLVPALSDVLDGRTS